MIQLSDLTKAYPSQPNVQVLKGVSLRIADGELVSIMGTSGSGKSTLLNVIGGLDRQYGGSAVVADRDVKKLSDRDLSHFRNRTIGFVFQAFNLLPHLTCSENVRLPAYFMSEVKGEALERRTDEALDAVGLLHKRAARPLELSGGERQRIAIARALFNRPKILLCDEPTGALDTKTGDRILALFEALNRERGQTVILVTHEPRVSARADRIVRIEDGVIVSDEPTRPGEA
ncbi:MAG: macrolide ABC transporter ATP-binding protein [Myxococcales bacterium]